MLCTEMIMLIDMEVSQLKSNSESQLLDIHPTLEICVVSVNLSNNKKVLLFVLIDHLVQT